MDERDAHVMTAGARPLVDHLDARLLKLGDASGQGFDSVSDVVKAWPPLLDEFRDRAVGRRWLEELDPRFPHLEEGDPYLLIADCFLSLVFQSKDIAVKLKLLVNRRDRNADVIDTLYLAHGFQPLYML